MTTSSVIVGALVGFVGLLAVVTERLGPAESSRVLLLQAALLTVVPFLLVQVFWRPFADGSQRRMTRLSAVVGAIVAVIAVTFIAARRWEAWTDWPTFLFDTIAYPLLLFALIQVLWPGRGFRRSIGRFGSGARSSGRTPIPSRLKQEIFARDERLCRYCGHYAINAEVDHVLPVARGGTNTPKNLVTACRECNAIKADRTPDEAGMVLHEAGYRAPNFMAAMAVGEAMKHQDRARSGGDRRP